MMAPTSRLQTAQKYGLEEAYHTSSFYSPLADVEEKSFRKVRFQLATYHAGQDAAILRLRATQRGGAG
jgi:hypothetical protein